jgi:acyl-coenzyme A thioesterase PaaI-like protein
MQLWPRTDVVLDEDRREFSALIESLRRVLDEVVGATPPAEVSSRLASVLAGVADDLSEHQVPELDQWFGRLANPGHGQVLAPEYVIDSSDDSSFAGRVTFRQFFRGGNGAAHGGSLPLFFDDVLGILANSGGRSASRTAYLHVEYRSITRIGAGLTVAGRVIKEEGRKCFVVAELHDGDTLVAEAEGLFVTLRPGQP